MKVIFIFTVMLMCLITEAQTLNKRRRPASTTSNISYEDIAQQKFRFAAEQASKEGFVGAYPNFHEANSNGNIVGGTIFLKQGFAVWQDVPLAGLGTPSLTDFGARMRRTHDHAISMGYLGGFPTFFHADYGNGIVCGSILINKTAGEFRDVPWTDLGSPPLNDIRKLFTSANDYAFKNGFLGGYPTFYHTEFNKEIKCGIVLIKKEAAEWRDVIIAPAVR